MHAEKVARIESRLNPDDFGNKNGDSGASGDEADLPGEKTPYQAMALQANHEITSLIVIMGKDGWLPGGTAYHSLDYMHMGHGTFGFIANGEQEFWFPFADPVEPVGLRVRGRNVLKAFRLISLKRMPWIRMKDEGRDFQAGEAANDRTPVITRIEVKPWVPEEIEGKRAEG